VKKGNPVPTNEAGQPLSGVTLVGYKEPIFPSTGEETATTLLAKLAGSDVSTANDSAILSGTSGSALQMIAREGSPAPNTLNGGNTAPVGTFQSFTSVAMPGNSGTIWFTATLAHSGGITSANDTGIWVSSPGSGVRLLMREGSDIPGIRTQTVKSIRVLDPVVGSPGHGRYAENFVGVQVSFDDGTDSVFNIDVNGGIENDLSTGQPLNPGGPVPTKFGIPNWRQTGSVPAVLLATLGGPGVTPFNNRAIVEYPSVIARKGSPTGLRDGSTFKAFKDPVTALDQDGFPVDAFPATLTGGTTTATNDTGLWWWHGAAPALSVLAREGGFAPGGGQWSSFNSVTTIEGRGPVFTATLAVDGSAITSENDDGVWAINSAGALRPLFREGDVIAGRTLSSFNVLGVVNGSPGQRRAWTESAEPTLVWRAFFTDATSAIVKTTVP
jgi:hypothetical protein